MIYILLSLAFTLTLSYIVYILFQFKKGVLPSVKVLQTSEKSIVCSISLFFARDTNVTSGELHLVRLDKIKTGSNRNKTNRTARTILSSKTFLENSEFNEGDSFTSTTSISSSDSLRHFTPECSEKGFQSQQSILELVLHTNNGVVKSRKKLQMFTHRSNK